MSTPFIPVLQETLKSVIAQYNASQLLTMREVSPCQHCQSRQPTNCRPCWRQLAHAWQPAALLHHPRYSSDARRRACTDPCRWWRQPFSITAGTALPWCPLQVVSRDIRRILTQRAAYFNIFLDDVSITQLTFSREYTHAVEAKQVAQQDAERARFIVSLREASG